MDCGAMPRNGCDSIFGTRTLNRQLLRYLEQKAPAPQTLRQRFFNAARSAKSQPGNGKPFAVRDGRFELLDAREICDRNVLFSLLTEAAREGVPLSRRAERSIAYIMKHPELPVKNA